MKELFTMIYGNDYQRAEKLVSLREYIEMDRLNIGQKIIIARRNKDGEFIEYPETIWIGNATLYHQPTDNDAEIGWDFDDEIMDYYVMEVREYN
jgi:hypothetical protein